jgi:hypothetical protein
LSGCRSRAAKTRPGEWGRKGITTATITGETGMSQAAEGRECALAVAADATGTTRPKGEVRRVEFAARQLPFAACGWLTRWSARMLTQFFLCL